MKTITKKYIIKTWDELTLKDYKSFDKLEEIDDFIKEVLGVE
jgi:hypothetical protein